MPLAARQGVDPKWAMLKHRPLGRYMRLLLCCLIVSAAIPALAIPPNTPITNTVTANYQVGGVSFSVFANDTIITDANAGNSAPSGITLNPAAVDENLSAGVVGLVVVADSDVGDNHTFVVSDARFEVLAGELRLRAGISLDFEAEPSVNLTITATDIQGASIVVAFVVTVNDLNEAPTAITLSATSLLAQTLGAAVGDVTVMDPDVGDSHTFVIDDPRFEIVGGELKLIDTESLPLGASVDILVTATDSGGLTYAQTFTITSTPPGGGSGTPANISFLQYAPGGAGALANNVGQSQCSSTGLSAGPFQDISGLVDLTGVGIGLPGVIDLGTVFAFKSGEPVFIQVIDPDGNLDDNLIDQIFITLSSSTGDSELLLAAETANASGIFIAYIQSVAGNTSVNDCVLGVAVNVSIAADYVDATDPTDLASVSVLIDPLGLVFDSASGMPINGARITLINAVTGQPANVSGDAPFAAFPATVESGGSVTDSGGLVYNFAPGRYRFPFVNAGDYRLEIVPPNRFAFPSTALDGDLQALPGAPYALGPGSRGNTFSVPVGPAVQVDVPLDLLPITPTASNLSLLTRASGHPSASSEIVVPSQCFNGSDFINSANPVSRDGITSSLPANLELLTTNRFQRGDAVYIQLTDLDQDQNPFAPDQIIVDVTVVGGDVERVQLLETGDSTGVFTGFIQSSRNPAIANNCELSAAAGAEFEVRYVDAGDTGDVSSLIALLDPGFTVFSSQSGDLLNGATVTLVDALSGLPAIGSVFSEDGITSFPATVVSGGSAQDIAGNSFNFAVGSFRFPVIFPGNYRLEVSPPLSYQFPSSVADADLALLPGGPFVLGAAGRGLDFEVLAGVSAEVDVPLDPISAQVFVSKEASKDVAAIGDFVQYVVVVRNASSAGTITNLQIDDVLPEGFRFVSGSAKVDNTAASDPLIRNDGRGLSFQVPQLAPDSQVEIRYVVEITVAATLGIARNIVTAAGIGVGNANTGFADITVREDLLQSKATVLGQVVAGECDSDQFEGVANVRIYMEDGSYTVTDAQGRYHFEGIDPGTHVLQLDVTSLPVTHEIALCQDNTRHAGTKFSQFIDLQPGSLWRGDFRVAKKPPITSNITAQLASETTDEVVQYQFKLSGGVVPVHDLVAMFMLDDNLTYIAGSSRLDGVPIADPQGIASGALTFRLADKPAAFVVELSFKTQMSAAAQEFITKALVMLNSPSGKTRTPVLNNKIHLENPTSLVTIAETRAYFSEANADLSSEDAAAISRIRKLLAASTKTTVAVIGHADDRPLKAGALYIDNRELSMARANNVARYIEKELELPVTQIAVEGRGDGEPIANNGLAAGRAENRRVDMSFVGQVQLPSRGSHIVDSGVSVVEVVQEMAEQLPAMLIPEVDEGKAPSLDRTWLSDQKPGGEIIWPKVDYNPRIPAVKLFVKHAPGERVDVLVNQKLVNPLTYEGTVSDKKRGLALSQWKNLSLVPGNNLITVAIQRDGKPQIQLERSVHFSGAPTTAEIIVEESFLVADGITPAVLAVRFFDRDGFAARPGTTGDFSIVAPHLAYNEAKHLDQIGTVNQGYQRYLVRKDGIAYIQLEPTTDAGEVELNFQFDRHRTEVVRARLKPVARDWIVVGFAEGTIGYNTLSGNLTNAADAGIEDEVLTDGKLAFYAKGQIKGQWLLTLAYDSDKEKQAQLRQQIDPNRFYTLYGDGSQTRYDAESQRKLYVKLEREEFVALFGDFDTGFDNTELTRYARTLNGVSSQYYGKKIEVNTFISEGEQGLVRDEIPGDGTSGLYRLSTAPLLINSERIEIVTRDRFQTEKIIERISLVRHIDYSIDYDAGTLIFKQPVFAQDFQFNPIFIEAEYEVRGNATGDNYVAGARVAYQIDDADSEAALTYVRDDSQGRGGELFGFDVNWEMTAGTRLRVEGARTDSDQRGEGDAYLVELEHQSAKLAGRVYVREQQERFGLGQQVGLEAGTRKLGVEGDYSVNDHLKIRAQAFSQHNLIAGTDRNLAALEVEENRGNTRLVAGVRSVTDELPVGGKVQSTQATLGVSQQMLKGKLNLRADAELEVSGSGENPDFPTRAVVGADYHVNSKVTLVVEQELSWGDIRDTQDTRIGIKARPWAGADIGTTVQRRASENGDRLFATAGLLQQWRLDEYWLLDFGFDRVQTIKDNQSAADPRQVSFNPRTPTASGSINDDFTAVFAGVGYRREQWDVSTRLEFHQGDLNDKWNLLAGMSHQLSDGKVMSANLQLLNEKGNDGSIRDQGDLRFGIAWRPSDSRWIVLNRLDLVNEQLLSATFDTRTRKIVNNLNANYQMSDVAELSLQLGAKYVIEQIDGDEYKGMTGLAGAEYRHDINARWDYGVRAAVLHSPESNLMKYSTGVSLGTSFYTNMWVSFGYNFIGFEDDDFVGADYTAQGPYLKVRMKVDQEMIRRFFDHSLLKNSDANESRVR